MLCRSQKTDKELTHSKLLEILDVESYNFYRGRQVEDLKKHIWVSYQVFADLLSGVDENNNYKA